jgi:hypothetical protein
LASQRRAVPSRASICIQARSSQARATSSHQIWFWAGGGLKPSTLTAERELYFRPGIGHIKLVDLRDEHIRDLCAAIRLLNRPGEEEHPSEMLRRLREARASRDGHRVSERRSTSVSQRQAENLH